MEVGDKSVDGTEAIARGDEQARDAGVRRGPALARNDTLQRARARGAHGDDAFPFRLGPADAPGRALAQSVPLSVHAVVLHHGLAHRTERAQAHVQGHGHVVDAAGGQLVQERTGEMQSGGGRRHRTRRRGIDRLVAHPVALLHAPQPFDIVRQRRRADLFEHVGESAGMLEAEAVAARAEIAEHGRLDLVGERDAAPQARLLGGVHEGEPESLLRVERLHQEHRRAPAAVLAPLQARRDHLGIVEHQQVARRKEVAEGRETGMGDGTRPAIHHHEAGGHAVLGRVGGDQRLGKIIGQLFQQHGFQSCTFVPFDFARPSTSSGLATPGRTACFAPPPAWIPASAGMTIQGVVAS